MLRAFGAMERAALELGKETLTLLSLGLGIVLFCKGKTASATIACTASALLATRTNFTAITENKYAGKFFKYGVATTGSALGLYGIKLLSDQANQFKPG